MSGLPAGNPTDTMWIWVVSPWPSETQEILKYQWEEKLNPFWTGADPLAVAEALGEAVDHVHAKGTMLSALVQVTPSVLEIGSLMNIPARSWSCITLGFGRGEEWWRQFCYRLKMVGHDGWLSIENEDVLLNSLEQMEKSVALLQGAMPAAPADYKPQDI